MSASNTIGNESDSVSRKTNTRRRERMSGDPSRLGELRKREGQVRACTSSRGVRGERPETSNGFRENSSKQDDSHYQKVRRGIHNHGKECKHPAGSSDALAVGSAGLLEGNPGSTDMNRPSVRQSVCAMHVACSVADPTCNIQSLRATTLPYVTEHTKASIVMR